MAEISINKEPRGVYDFLTNFGKAAIKADDKSYVSIAMFFEEYPERFWLRAHPTSELSYDVTIPRNARLVFDIAMDPATYGQPGKGVRFEIERDGRKIFSEYLDPKSKKKDRGWFHHELPLKGEGKARITFRTLPAPRSNNYYCNAAWGRPHLAVKEER
jgi:hypothetical protein